MDDIRTWAQGYFVDQRQYDRWTPEQKLTADCAERHLVRPSPTGNAICKCDSPKDAAWIASRLNLASILEQDHAALIAALESVLSEWNATSVISRSAVQAALAKLEGE